MASKLGEIYVELAAVDSKYRASLAKAKGDGEKTAMAVEKRWQGISTAIAGAFAAVAAAGTVKYAVEEAIAAEQAQSKLAAALALTGDASRANLDAFAATAEMIQKVTTYEDDAIIAAMAYGKSIGIQTGQLQTATRAAVGLAEITGQDLNTAMLNVGRASQGVFGRLKMLLPSFKETGNAAVDFANLLKLTEGGFSLAEARAKTTGGALEQMKVTLGNLAESFGALLLPAMRAFVALTKPVVDFLVGLSPVTKNVIGTMAGLAAIIGGVIVVVQRLAAVWALVSKSAAAAAVAQLYATGQYAKLAGLAAAVVAAIAGISYALNSSSGDMDNYIEKLNKSLKDTTGELNRVNDVANGLAKNPPGKVIGADPNVKERYDAQAKSIMEVYQGIRQAREEDEKRKRAAIGWTALSDMWKGAASAGAQHRFPNPMERRDEYTDSKGVKYGGGKFAIDPEDWKRAMRIWEKQKESNEKTEAYLNDISNRLMSESALA